MKTMTRLGTAALAALLTSTAAPAAPAKAPAPFASADTNGDGKLSPREYAAAMKGELGASAARSRFRELDRNHDGSLSAEEYTPPTPRKGARAKRTAEKKTAEGT